MTQTTRNSARWLHGELKIWPYYSFLTLFSLFPQLAVKRALEDACLTYEDVEAAAVGSAMGANGQRVLYDVGLTG